MPDLALVAVLVAGGLDQPLYVTAPPGDERRLFIVEKTGRIRTLDLARGQLDRQVFLDLSDTVSRGGEQGLLGLAFDPGFAATGRFYVNYTNRSGDTEIRRFTLGADGRGDSASGQLVLGIDQPYANHNGGWLGFGPDGCLYIATGDGGSAGDPRDNAQNPGSLLGKMLRIDIRHDAFPEDPRRNYAIPPDNPFVGRGGAGEVWAYGLRNPWRASFDRLSGRMFAGDVGQDRWEEVDIISAGGNYGWNIYEAAHPYSRGDRLTGGPAIPPIAAYGHDQGYSITGGYVYRGPSQPLQGLYFYADYGSGRVWTAEERGGRWVSTERTTSIATTGGRIDSPASFGEDTAGHLYVIDLDGDIFRLTVGE